MKLAEFSIKHPAIVAMLLIVTVVFGVMAAVSLNAEMIPPVGLPSARIVTVYPGAAASDIERDISRKIENEMSTLAGVSELSSTSADSYSVVSMEFRDGADVQEKLPQIRELLNGIRSQLPDGIEGEPVIYVTDAAAFLPIFSVMISSDMDPVALTEYLEDNVSPAIARIAGVSKINLVGGSRKEARIVLDTRELAARGISALSIYEALRYNNLTVPAGNATFQAREMSFTASGAFSDARELENMTIGFGDGSYIYLSDVADILIAPEPREILVRSSGRDYIMLDVLKRSEGNTVTIVREAREALDAIRAETRGAVDYAVISDQSETTVRSLLTVTQAGVTGLLLTVLVILFVLHDLRATLIISLSIPLSFLFAFLGLKLLGRSMNLLSLAGLTVGIGMVVDNSIVVLENIHKHFKKTGDKRQASFKGTDEVGGSVLASTLTSVCVFIPLLFLSGMIGIIMNDLSLSIIFSLSASAIVALVVVPWLSSLILKPADHIRRPAALLKLEAGIDRGFDRLERAYRRILGAALNNKRFTLALAVSILVASLLLMTVLKISFIPPTDTGEFEIHLETPAGYSLDATRDKIDEVEALVSALVPEIETAVWYVGSSSSIAITSSSNHAFARIRLVPDKDRERRVQEILPLVQDALASSVPDCDATVLNGGFDALLALGTGGQGFQMEIYGTDVRDVAATAEMAREILSRDPDVFKTEISARMDDEQLYAKLSQTYMGTLGVTPYEAGVTSRILFGGMSAGTLREGEEDLPIRVTSTIAESEVDDDLLNDIALRTRDGRLVTFAAFSTIEARQTLSQVDRKDRNFSLEVRGYLRGDDQSGVKSRMAAAMAALELPYSVKYRTVGTSKLIEDSLSSMLLMLAISVFLVYTVMVIQFERFRQPLIIMASIPFCLIGVVLGLYLFDSSISILAMLAVITLGGTVVNNAIVLVDYTNMLRKDYGMDLASATVEGAAARIRPILMTAVTTLVGVLPMSFAQGDGSEVYAPLGQAIFGGMLTSTVITLIIIPVLYLMLETRRTTVAPSFDAMAREIPINE